MPVFKPGDLVRIKDGTHQDGMPDHRVGMIMELGETSKSYTKTYTVVFLGTGRTLKVPRNILRTLDTLLTFSTLTIARMRLYYRYRKEKIHAYDPPWCEPKT